MLPNLLNMQNPNIDITLTKMKTVKEMIITITLLIKIMTTVVITIMKMVVMIFSIQNNNKKKIDKKGKR